ncbi:MAG TPA: IPT/TIG domain-containing protein [Terriglobales bacterium]|jgi:hypothetical protein|nr:IPT/TIG domain-containing protein [Terriglobales bacterium]
MSVHRIALFILLPQLLWAGGPRDIAGTVFFESSVKGVPLTWAGGAINYYTDQGNLSPVLPEASADAFVANAFSRWTSIATAAVTAARAGQLAENVSGANVSANGGVIALPTDILPAAVSRPVAIVYDADGAVTDALLGQGAGDASSCFNNAVYGGVDSFSTDAHLLHALVVLNGNCAQTSQQLPDMDYRLVRVLGRVLGLDWSQVNVNVFTHNPAPTTADFTGLSIMHGMDPISCVPISVCYPNADQPKMDDRAALSRLYPVTAQNLASFPGKTLFFENTVRVHGEVHFADVSAQPAQAMQGVNVVARWIDPATSQPSRTYAAASVSGFLFRGNAGNPATGFNDSTGQAWDRFGSDDPDLQGFFDLAGLEIPNGANSAQYQLSVEPLDPLWSQAIGPYGPWQVLPSGTFAPLVVSVSKGGDLQQDILMQGSAIQVQDWFEPTSFAAPVALPVSGEWAGTLSGLGNADYFWLNAQGNRTLSVEVTALDGPNTASEVKAQPVIGMWALADPGTFPAPANTPLAFNTLTPGLTRLDATIQASSAFRVGIFDLRGDGRPDYRYRGRVFYADHILPSRARVDGGSAVTLQGVGFHSNTTANIAAGNAAVLAVSANQVIASAPAMADGAQNVTLQDPSTGASSTMTAALTYGAGPNDTIKLIQGSNPATPAGGQAPNPIRVQVLAPDGMTPVSGASVFFTSTPAVAYSACGGSGSCTLLTDDSGQASTQVTVLQAAVINITVILAPASYKSPKSVQTTLLGVSSALDLSLASPFAWIAQGATVDVALSARLLSNGAPMSGTVNYQVVKGSGALSSSAASSDSNGFAKSTLHVASLAGDVQVSACVAPANKPCQIFSATAVPASFLQLQAVGGSVQIRPVGQAFQPVTVRVTDSAIPTHPVLGANVTFQVVVSRPVAAPAPVSIGGIVITKTPAPVIVSSSQFSVASDAAGLATLQPSASGALGAIVIQGTSAAGAGILPFRLQSLVPVTQAAGASQSAGSLLKEEVDRKPPGPRAIGAGRRLQPR